MKETTIKVLIVEPNKRPYKSTVIRNIKIIKEIVCPSFPLLSGVDVIEIEDNVFLIHNPEGALLGLKGNRKLKNNIIAGTFLVVQTDKKGKITSLSNNNLTKYTKRFWDTEQYTDEEVSDAYWIKWIATIDDLN